MKFPKKFIAAVLILVIGIVGVIICALPKYSDVEAVVADYVAAVDAGDTEAMFECTIAKAASNAMNQFSEEYGDVFGEAEETVENTLKNADFEIVPAEADADAIIINTCGFIEAAKAEAIENIFGILIECDVKDGYKYYIENEEDLKENSIQNWLFSTLSVNNLLSESVSLKNKILLETIPTNGNYLEDIIKAIKDKRRVEIEYKKYGGD